MEYEKLIRAIATAVMTELGKAPAREEVLLMGSPECPFCQKVAESLGDARILWPENAPEAGKSLRRIVPFVSNGNLVDLARGKAGDAFMALALAALLEGHPVEVATFEYTQYQETAPSALLAVYREAEATLASFGMRKMERALPNGYRVEGGLITEADVKAASLAKAKTLVISPNARVTALAEETARDLSLAITRK